MLSVVVPTYNEQARLPPTLCRLREFLDGAIGDYEVLVVDDGSTDATVAGAEAAEAGWPQLRVLQLDRNRGKGAAVRAGMLAARGDRRLFTDADLSTPVEEVLHLADHIGGPCTVAIASRAVDRGLVEHHQDRRREAMGRAYNILVRAVLLGGIRDTQCGFKLFTADAAVACFTPLQTMRFGFDVEVLWRARRLGWTVAEVPVRWRHVDESRVHPVRDAGRMLIDLVSLRLRLGGRADPS